MTGEVYTPHKYLFCHFDPKKSKYEKKRFVHNAEWELYDDGRKSHKRRRVK
jgi:hypothetical protein